MNAISVHVQNDAAELKTRTAASENLALAAQAMFGLKVILGIAALVALTLAISTAMIWLSPFWAHWF